MDQINKDVGEIKVHIGEIKTDLRHHIKRSDSHELSIKLLEQALNRIQGGMLLLSLVLVVVSIWDKLK